MEENKSILHELYVFSEWKSEPEYLQKPDSILPENISVLWKWLRFFGAKKSLIDSITLYKEHQQKWQIALGDQGKVIAVLTDYILEIRTKRSEYATIAARTTVSRDGYAQWRKLVWSPDCSFLALAYGNGVVSFFDLTASNLFNIPIDCSRPGGLECTDTTHAVADIIFLPLRVKDIKWNWEVLILTYDGKLRGYLVSQTDGFKLHHTFRFDGGVGAVAYSAAHSLLYVAGLPTSSIKDPSSPLHAGITAWRILNDDPFYKLSVVSDQLEAQLATERFQLYIPYLTAKKQAFIVKMSLSPDGGKLACVHCTGDVSVWRLPLLGLICRTGLQAQPDHDLESPLLKDNRRKHNMMYCPVDINWWTNEEIILSRFSGAVSVCTLDVVNILGKKPEFMQGAPQVTGAYDGAFMALECESKILPAKKSHSDESMEVVRSVNTPEDTVVELTKEMLKSVLYTFFDSERFQPKPKRITVVSRIYRLLGIKSTTPVELFTRKIESGHYSDALSLAETYNLDSDLVYQQQWRKTHVSTDAIKNYLSKVSKKIWAVHQCVDRLPETSAAAADLLHFGLQLTNEEIIKEINKDRTDNLITDPEQITLEDLNAYTSELLRCRHVMLFHRERLQLYEAILKCEKSTYVKDEYDRIRNNNLVHSAVELAKEGRINGLTCLWPHIKSVLVQLDILDKFPETVDPFDYSHLLPAILDPDEKHSPVREDIMDSDWCHKDMFRSIWSSNWSEDVTPDMENPFDVISINKLIPKWYEKRAREIEELTGLVFYAISLVTIGLERGIGGMVIMFNLLTLDTLVYEIYHEDMTLKKLEKLSTLEICKLLMHGTTEETFVSDLKEHVIPFLKRYEKFYKEAHTCLNGLTDYLEDISVDNFSLILAALEDPNKFELDVRTQLELVERCLLAHRTTQQLDMACRLYKTVVQETDGTISQSELVRRHTEVGKYLDVCVILAAHDALVTVNEVKEMQEDEKRVQLLLTRMARNTAIRKESPKPQDWDLLLKDILELQSSMFHCISKELCHEIYVSSLLTSGDMNSIRLSSSVMSCSDDDRHIVPHDRAVALVADAAKEYFNSASSLTDPTLELAKCCLSLIRDPNELIQQELDLISSLSLLNSFGLTLLPIQVRLCEDRIKLIQDCLKVNANAYLASHKLLKLANLMRVAGDDERKREGVVMQLIGECAMVAGAAGGPAAAEAARRLAALRHAPASPLLRQVALSTPAPPDPRTLLAASLAHCAPEDIVDIINDRLNVEIKSLQKELAEKVPSVYTMNYQEYLAEYDDKYECTDDEFSDAITTPTIEKRDLIIPQMPERKAHTIYLKDSWQNKFLSNAIRPQSAESVERTVYVQEFYADLYCKHRPSKLHYGYDRFSLPDLVVDGQPTLGHSVLRWYYTQCSLEKASAVLEMDLIQKCAEEFLYQDTPLGVSCLLRSAEDQDMVRRYIGMHTSCLALALMLYALLVKYNKHRMREQVFLTQPAQMVRSIILSDDLPRDVHLEMVTLCLDKLIVMMDCEKLRMMGYSVSSPVFMTDEAYRKEILQQVASTTNTFHVFVADGIATKFSMDTLGLWVLHAHAVILNEKKLTTSDVLSCLMFMDLMDNLTKNREESVKRLHDVIWVSLEGHQHNAMIHYFTLVKNVDDKNMFLGLSPVDHIKILKKVKSACQELNYKLMLSEPSFDEISAHLLQILKAGNIGIIAKLLRSLPAIFRIPISVSALYKLWLTKEFFSVPLHNATSKKWMQQYRQCSSYFNKLSKDDLLEFVVSAAFSSTAVDTVPAGTRSLMIMQAVDYCQQEQENEIKLVKNEVPWSQVGQEMTRWARFLENFHSSTVQGIIDNSNIDRQHIWRDIEMSYGKLEVMRPALCRLVMESDLKPTALDSILNCLHVELTPDQIFMDIVQTKVDSLQHVETLVSRLIHYHKDNVQLSEALLEEAVKKATQYDLPPHKQISLLSLSQKNQIQDGDDLLKIINFTVDLFKTEWADVDYAENLTEDSLQSEEGRREVFSKFLSLADTWQRKKALVDVLNCWPISRKDCESRSLQCEYLYILLSNTVDLKENLILIKLLLRKPVLTDEEIKWLMTDVQGEAVVNVLWVIMLSKSEALKNDIPKYVQTHKNAFQQLNMDDDLIKELLDNNLFIKTVCTPLYSFIINYILNNEASSDQASNDYDLNWAMSELVKANFVAEAGHLHLMSIGVPTSLRGFSQSILYNDNVSTSK